MAEDERVDAAGHHPLLEVLDAGPALEGGAEVEVRVPEPGEASAYLVGDVALERQAGGRVGPLEEQVADAEQPDELADRVRVVVDPQVDEDVAAAAVAAARA